MNAGTKAKGLEYGVQGPRLITLASQQSLFHDRPKFTIRPKGHANWLMKEIKICVRGSYEYNMDTLELRLFGSRHSCERLIVIGQLPMVSSIYTCKR